MSLEHCLQSTILATAAMLVSDETDEELANLVVGKDIERSRKGSVRRLRQRFLTVTQHLSEEEFKTAFRMTRGTFFLLLSRLRPHLLRNEEMAQRSSGGVVQPEVRLAITLRMLAGGSYIDQMMCWGVGRSMTFRIFLDTIHAIMKEIEMPGLPLGNEVALRDPLLESRNLQMNMFLATSTAEKVCTLYLYKLWSIAICGSGICLLDALEARMIL